MFTYTFTICKNTSIDGFRVQLVVRKAGFLHSIGANWTSTLYVERV